MKGKSESEGVSLSPLTFPCSSLFPLTFSFPLVSPLLLRLHTAIQDWWNLRRIGKFRDRYVGRRCFIVANGPSLNRTDLSKLKGEYTFGLNRIYLLSERTGFVPSFYVAVNNLVIRQFASDIEKLKMPKFLENDCRDAIRADRHTYFLRYWPVPSFVLDFRRGVWHGATVTNVAIQLAYFMGFTEVYLVGLDHAFQFNGRPHEPQTSTEPDPNHFDPQYFGPGIQWHLPDLATSELAYRIARHQFEITGRKILNATHGGALEIFDRVNYDGLF